MRILLVWPFYIQEEVPLGVLYLSAMLKPQGHQTALFCLNPFPWYGPGQRRAAPQIKTGFREQLHSFRPDLVGFSVISTGLDMSLELARIVREYSLPVIFGGAHATVDPEGTIALDEVDMVCMGEGEYAFLELVTALEAGGDITGIANIWVKRNGQIYRNPLRPLIRDLDSLPHPDRDILELSHLSYPSRGATFITSRGCPYKCSYCDNDYRNQLYNGKGSFVRYRSIPATIAEVRGVVERIYPKEVVFSDEIFTLNRRRTIEFLKAYREEIGLPFICQTRANHVTAEIAASLKEARCRLVSLGIESGNEHIRNNILNRKMGQETIYRAFDLLREAGVRTSSFNMLGMPTETEDMVWDTININRRVRPDHVHCTVLMPLKGTQIRDMYERGNLLREQPHGDTYSVVIQKLPDLTPQKLLAYQRVFPFYVYADRRLFFLIHLLRLLWLLVPEKVRFYHRPFRFVAYRLHSLATKILERTAYRWREQIGNE